MKIAILVPGRFHVFEQAGALLARGHEVTVFTHYPAWMARKFGFPPEHVKSFLALGAAHQVVFRLLSESRQEQVGAVFLKALGKWAAKQAARQRWDVVHAFSGMAEESIHAIRGTRHLLMRASSHIRTQAELLRQEAGRVGVPLAQPSPWIVEREEREYAAADYIVVVSRFCYDSFLRQGVPAEKLLLLPLGADTRNFRISEEAVERRCRRILSGAPLTVLTTGQVSFRKGLYDFDKIAAACNGRVQFRWMGFVRKEATETVRKLPACVQMMAHQPQLTLPRVYAEADLFLLPTIEDGYPIVLAQANANALPLLTTANCSGPDIIHEAQTGWVLPIRNPEAFVDRLFWCDAHRDELARMVRDIARKFRPRDWNDVAVDFESLCAATAAV